MSNRLTLDTQTRHPIETSALEPLSPQLETSPTDLILKIAQRHPFWRGILSLKNLTVDIQINFFYGFQYTEKVLRLQTIVVTQRMRLEHGTFETLSARMKGEQEWAVGIVTPLTGKPGSHQYFTTNYVTYLSEKQAAGVVQLNSDYVYLIPPCPFAIEQIQRFHSDIIFPPLNQASFLLAIMVKK